MPARIADLYGGGYTGELMNSRFRDGRGNPRPKVALLLQRRHATSRESVGPDNVYRVGEHEWKVPIGLLYYWYHPLRQHQMVIHHPWWVVWHSPRSGAKLRKAFTALPQAIHFIATKAQYVDPGASVVAKHPYEVIPALRGKLPTQRNGHTYYWCPLCVTARTYHRVSDRSFHVMKKVFSHDQQRYVWTERRVYLLACRTCGCTNANMQFRRSNQPWEKRVFARGVRRAKRGR